MLKKFFFVVKNIVSGIYLPPMHGQHSSYPSSYSIKVIPYLDIVQDHLLCLDGGKEPALWVDYTKVGTAAILQFALDFSTCPKLGLFV